MNREGAQIGWMELWMEEGGKGEDGVKVRRTSRLLACKMITAYG